MEKSKKTTEGVETPSVDTVQVEKIEKSLYDDLVSASEREVSALNQKIDDLKSKLAKEQEYSKELEETYSTQIESNSNSEFDYIPLVNIIDGKKVTRDQVVADKKLLKLFKK